MIGNLGFFLDLLGPLVLSSFDGGVVSCEESCGMSMGSSKEKVLHVLHVVSLFDNSFSRLLGSICIVILLPTIFLDEIQI